MSYPLCDKCGARHHEKQAHRFAPSVVVHAAVANPPVANESVANSETRSVANPESYRVQVWREANRERYNARQRELMKRRRAL